VLLDVEGIYFCVVVLMFIVILGCN
jgi:hypothetical protein